MRAWDATIFGNDDAVDWTFEFVEEEDNKLSFITFTFDEVLDTPKSEEIPAEQGCYALAAADIVARMRGQFYARTEYTRDVDAWVARHRITPSRLIVSKAQKAVERISGDGSELRDLWKDSDEFALWEEEVNALKARLQAQQ